MPVMDVTTTQAKEIWRSPDGQRVIFELTLEANGQPFPAKTFSKEIAEIGWSGSVETYEKPGRGGIETFVKQPQKDQYRGGGYAGGFKPSGKDEAAIQAMWAITKAIEWAAIAKQSLTLEDIEPLAKDFNAMVEMVKTGQSSTVKPDDVVPVLDGQISIDDIKFPGEE